MSKKCYLGISYKSNSSIEVINLTPNTFVSTDSTPDGSLEFFEIFRRSTF